MHVAEIWRYPVKSMAGERLASAELREDGIAGDRVVMPVGADGRIHTARTWPRLLGHRAVLGPDGEPLVDGRPWRDPSVARDVEAAAGAGTRLARHDGLDRFDELPLLVATDGAIHALGRDGRRLRPNLVVGGVEGLAERAWEGSVLRIGEALVRAVDLRARCVMTTYDPDSLAQDPGVLRDIVERFAGTMALNAVVLRGGLVREGDRVEIDPEASWEAGGPGEVPL
jgi:uncharacterized protein YcbX